MAIAKDDHRGAKIGERTPGAQAMPEGSKMAEALLEQRCCRLELTLLASNAALVGEHLAETVPVADPECQELTFTPPQVRRCLPRLL